MARMIVIQIPTTGGAAELKESLAPALAASLFQELAAIRKRAQEINGETERLIETELLTIDRLDKAMDAAGGSADPESFTKTLRPRVLELVTGVELQELEE